VLNHIEERTKQGMYRSKKSMERKKKTDRQKKKKEKEGSERKERDKKKILSSKIISILLNFNFFTFLLSL
jgi:hypothetical protein